MAIMPYQVGDIVHLKPCEEVHMNRFTLLGNGHQLPYRVEIDGLRGAANTPVEAVCAALSAGGKIPAGMRNGKEAAAYLFWNYEATPAWVELISVLEHNKFPATQQLQSDMPDPPESYYNHRAEERP